ncbi:hypothetical protein [Erwinia tasmaniensis]|uniref:Uncharacterized protein n=1 Tax=Erwinia tasmaniensis (strain DSM 17950 / CFBP 7177 / CIP 109463 / NCPPB 4357 / Et1/99) TaxID=465817 RepID=B2VL08_ERWT9|nr:hypothetical protein [Erwinia tasmaniensis]CAO97930.1 hypothetical protein ETA_28840 [Erwinia tasmaniensis Et1/99]
MKISTRTTWIALFIFCLLVWALIIISLVCVSNRDEKKLQQPAQQDANKLVKKLKRLDLNEKQKQFIDSLIVSDEKKQ